MDLHALMLPYAESAEPRLDVVAGAEPRHRADGPAVETDDPWWHDFRGRHRADRLSV